MATCIKKNIAFSKIASSNSDNVQCIVVQVGNFLIKNIYANRDTAVTEQLLQDLYDHDLLRHSVLMGDLNSHHPQWDASPTNKGGRVVSDFILDKDLVILNNGTPTKIQAPSHNHSAVDLTIVDGHLAIKSQWSVLQDSGNSDHFPTRLVIDIQNNHNFIQTFSTPYKQRNYDRADWSVYHDRVLVQILLSEEEVDYDSLVGMMDGAAEECIPYKNSGCFGGRDNPWWDQECSEWVKRRKRALGIFSAYPTMENFIQAKKEIALARKHLRKKKNLLFFANHSIEIQILNSFGTKLGSSL